MSINVVLNDWGSYVGGLFVEYDYDNYIKSKSLRTHSLLQFKISKEEYRQLLLSIHPDKNPGNDEAAKLTQELNSMKGYITEYLKQ
ncbi:MAG: hypothetical protein ACOCVN_03535 [bacterium]